MDPGEYVDFLVLLIEQLLQLPHLRLQLSYPFLQRLGVSTWKRSTTELIARLAFESNIDALCATRSDAVASNLLRPAAVASLGYTRLVACAHFDNLHRKYSRHFGRCLTVTVL